MDESRVWSKVSINLVISVQSNIYMRLYQSPKCRKRHCTIVDKVNDGPVTIIFTRTLAFSCVFILLHEVVYRYCRNAKWGVIFSFVISWSFVTSCDRLETNVTDFLFFNAKWPVSKNFCDHDPSNAYVVVKWPVISWRFTNFVIKIINCSQII